MTPDPASATEAMRSLSIDVDVREAAWSQLGEDSAELTARLLQRAWSDISETDNDFEVSVVLADDGLLQQLNQQYRGKDTPTNVLSFPTDIPESDIIPAGEPVPLGDVVLSYQTLSREARDLGIEMQDHFTHLLVHGMLHLIGFDHETDEDAAEMEAKEINILANMGIANPYEIEDGLSGN